MAFTNFTIIPDDSVVIIDGAVASGVSMTGISPDVHAIQWYGDRTSGFIEFKANPATGILPGPEEFTSPAPYSAQTSEAEAIIYAANNPVTYYSTVSGNVYGGVTYSLGSPIVIDTPSTPQPADTTTDVPPTPEDFQQLYWYSNAWVISGVDPTLSLSDAKTALNTAIEASAAGQATLQARIYSPVQLSTAPDITALATADYFGVDLGEYQTFLDGEVSSMQAQVNAAASVSALYSFNPTVEGNPNA